MSLHVSRVTEISPGDEPRRESENEPVRPATTAAIVVVSSGAMQRRAKGPAGPHAAQRDAKADDRHSGQWTSVERAAAFLGVPVVTLRRTLERAARRRADGSVIAQADGIVARKLGRVWRVWLDAEWRDPSAAK